MLRGARIKSAWMLTFGDRTKVGPLVGLFWYVLCEYHKADGQEHAGIGLKGAMSDTTQKIMHLPNGSTLTVNEKPALHTVQKQNHHQGGLGG